MPRPKRLWFRLYVEMPSDRKVRRLDPKHRWLLVCVFGAARQSPKPGWLLLTDDDPWTVDDLADYANLPRRDVVAGMAAIERAGIVEKTNEAWRVTKWDERQFESDDVTARTQRHRSKEPDRNVPTPFQGTDQRTETENRYNPPTPPSGDGGNRHGLRGTGTSPRELRDRAQALAHSDAEAEKAEQRSQATQSFARQHFAEVDRWEVSHAALELWPHEPEMRSRAIATWERLRSQDAATASA